MAFLWLPCGIRPPYTLVNFSVLAYSPKLVEGAFCEVHALFVPSSRTGVSRAASPRSKWYATTTTTTRELLLLLLLMGQNDTTTRLPPGYALDLVGDPCVIVLRRADRTVAARFTKHVDPEEIRRAAEEDHRGVAGGRESAP
jgi:hypothetical protein